MVSDISSSVQFLVSSVQFLQYHSGSWSAFVSVSPTHLQWHHWSQLVQTTLRVPALSRLYPHSDFGHFSLSAGTGLRIACSSSLRTDTSTFSCLEILSLLLKSIDDFQITLACLMTQCTLALLSFSDWILT